MLFVNKFRSSLLTRLLAVFMLIFLPYWEYFQGIKSIPVIVKMSTPSDTA